MPEIIQFSNQLCYTGTPLKPLRQYPPERLEPILVRHVKDGFREGSSGNALNRPEADALVETLVDMCSSKEYDGKTMGVISLQGETQAKYIESKLLTRLSPTDLETRRIVCGDAYAFQGDERDIILLSMVTAPTDSSNSPRRIGALVREADKRRFNVAASRAKNQSILFYTATLNELHPNCMRHKLLEYYLNPTAQGQVEGVDFTRLRELSRTGDRRRGTQPSPFESWFEVDVCLDIADHGFRVIPQYNVAGYFIDLVVEDGKSQLAVECDGDEWHGIEQYERDVARQRILERCGWRFWRIRGHEYYRDPVDAVEPLWKLLSDMGIRSALSSEFDSTVPSKDKEEDKGSGLLQMPSKEVEVEPANIVEAEPILETKPDATTDAQIEGETKDTVKSGTLSQSEFCNYTPQFFFKLAHQAREKKQLESWERSLIYKVGQYRARGWQISEKMEHQAIRITQTARQSGLVDAIQLELGDDQLVEPPAADGESHDTPEDMFHWFYSDGLIELFMAKSPIQHANRGLELSFVALEFREPAHTEVDCHKLGLTYASPLYARTRLLIKDFAEIKEQDIYLADIPMVTKEGTFIIDGMEKTLIIDSLINRSLGQSPIDKGLENLKSTAISRMSRISLETVTPARLIDIGPFRTAVTEFFMESREETNDVII